MFKLQYYDNLEWLDCSGEFASEALAWMSLGDDKANYRVVPV